MFKKFSIKDQVFKLYALILYFVCKYFQQYDYMLSTLVNKYNFELI
jgi:hypothetical protein